MPAAGQGSAVARNYADALLVLGRRAGDAAGWGSLLRHVAEAVDGDATLRRFLDAPRVPADVKGQLLARALGAHVPTDFLRFLQLVVRNRRQGLIPAIAGEYDALLDQAEGVVHARVTVARPTDDAGRDAIAARLSAVFGKTVLPDVVVDPAILGGIVVRMGDTVIDGSVRRKLGLLRRRMVARPVG